MSLLSEPGDLAQTPLAAILLEALNQRATGVLEVVHGGGTSRLWFRDGRPVGAQVFAGFKPLGMMLLQAGLIDIDALSKSLALMAETKRPQGTILVEMGVVSEADVQRMLAEQQASYFGVIAALDSGPFAFDEATPVPEWTHGCRLSAGRTIIDALERPQATALVGSALQPVAAGGIRLLPGHAEQAEALHWTEAERALVARLEKPVTLEAFLAPSAVTPERARAVLSGLLLLGLAGPQGEASEAAVLELSPEDAVAPAAPTPAPAAPGRRSDPAEARARRQRLLQQAMRNMGVGPFAARAAGGRPEGGATPPPSPAGGAARPTAVASPVEQQLREALLAIAPRAKEADLFARLGIPDSSGREDAKRAFLAIARQFHPDRFSGPALADLHDVVKDFFAAVNEAYEVLSDDRKRADYLVARRGQASVQAEAARVDFQKGEACLGTRDWARARGFLESAVRADPRPEHQAALAYACLVDPHRRDRERARRLLAEATRDPTCDRAFYVAGILARDEGDAGTAERHFRAAVKVNARNTDALRELRLLESRRADKRR